MNPIETLMAALRLLPGIGRKSAQRLAYYLIKCPKEEAESIINAIRSVRETLKPCSTCAYLSDSDPCSICSDETRKKDTICVVEDSLNVIIIDRSQAFNGVYHILGGIISPLRGVGPEQLNLDTLIERVRREEIKEVILATNPTVEGMVTSRYIEKLLEPYPVKLTELARGLSVGSDLEFADDITIALAIEGRREVV